MHVASQHVTVFINSVTSPPPVPPSDNPGAPTLPRDLVLFFVQFSVALNKARAYPPGHPVLAAAMDVLVQHLNAMFQRRQLLTIGVSRGHLVVDGAASDDDHTVIKELAERLHRHQLAAVQLRPGLKSAELSDLLHGLGVESWRQGKPLGLEPLEQLSARWPHVALEPIPLDQLELGDSSETTLNRQAEQVWRGLVNTALLLAQEGSGGSGSPKPVTAREVVKAIKARKRKKDKHYNRQVLDLVMEAGEQAGRLDQSSPVRREVDQLFAGLDSKTLHNMMKVGASAEERTQIVRRGARSLPVNTVLDMLDATAKLADRNLSHSLLALLGKLARHGDAARGPVVVGAEDVLRDSVRQLVSEWDEEDPGAQSHRDLLALLARPGSAGRSGISGKAEAGSLQVAQMGLELGVHSPEVQTALLEVRSQSGLTDLLELVDRGTQAGLSVDNVWRVLCDPAFLGRLLLDDAQDVVPVERVLDHMGADALDLLLEALEGAESASRRRWLLRRIQDFGDITAPRIVARLPGKPWYVQRNLLNLLGAVRSVPAQFRPDDYLQHEDARVRREAYKLLFANAEWRADAMVKAAGDQDSGIVRLALSAALENCPVELTPRVLDYLGSRYRDHDIRVLAIRLLGKRPSTGGREWLIRRVASSRGWGPFRRFRLEPKSPEVLAALVVLNQTYADQADAAAVLRMADASKDPDLRAASRGVLPRTVG